MAIYRGDGGAGDATNDITINQITELSSETQIAATAAASSATSASSSASAASTSATNAANSATSAGTSATNAASSASSASTSASNASTSETNAAASETAAAASEAAAALSETAAASSETNAATSATNAATSETNASNSATAAASSAGVAALNATSAADSASSAATSASNAATSETNAASSATSASNDAATATTKASEASTSASNAATSETNAAASESAAAISATNASISETNAAASETAAASSASAAATSATNAATSASGASTSASNAATSASNAATSETNAATSETNAAASATAAAASAASAASSDYATSSWYTTTNNASNWDTAYGWGNHASAGYVVADGAVVINESGADVDFRIESDTNANAFFLEGSSGNVGIGTSSPVCQLQVSGASAGELELARFRLEGATNNPMLRFFADEANKNLTIATAGSTGGESLAIDVSGSERMRIDSSGNVGIGTSSPSYTLDVSGTGRFSGLVVGRNSASTDVNDANDTGSFSVRGSASTVAAMSFHRVGAFAINMGLGTDNIFRIGGWSASDDAFQLNGSGDVTALGDVTAYSDERLKENWKDLPEGFVANLAGVKSGTYNRIDLDGKQQVGVSAQSLQTVLPDAVIESNDTLAVNYGNAALASAIELAKKVVELEARIKELEGK